VNHDVPCPCGRHCKGATLVSVPRCFLSEEDTRSPPALWREFWKQHHASGGGLLSTLAILGITAFGTYAAIKDGSSAEDRYETYQCPTCGCTTYFMEYTDTAKRRIRKLAGSINRCGA
jgi:hypothetical protein